MRYVCVILNKLKKNILNYPEFNTCFSVMLSPYPSIKIENDSLSSPWMVHVVIGVIF